MRVISNNPAVDNEEPYKKAEKVVDKAEGTNSMADTNKAINKERRECTISKDMISLLVTQLRAELSNYNLVHSTKFSRINILKVN